MLTTSNMDYNSRLIPPAQQFESALRDHTTYSQIAGDVDTSVIGRAGNLGRGAKSENPRLNWNDFKTEPYESNNDEETKREVTMAILDNYDKHVNLTNYMIEEPVICHNTDRLKKVCDLFRHM